MVSPYLFEIGTDCAVNTCPRTTYYVYDGPNIIMEYVKDDLNNSFAYRVTATYIHVPGIDEPLSVEKIEKNGPTSIYYYHADELGSITALSDAQGNIVQRYQYDAFGNMTITMNGNIKQPYGFTGREYDAETGLYYYRARYYDPKVGRFVTKYPIGFAGGDVNLYNYVGANPVNWRDPEGLYTLVALYQGAGTFGHIGIGVNSKNTTGFYPESSSSVLDLITGQPVPGTMWPDTDIPITTILIRTSPEQEQAIKTFINDRRRNPGKYELDNRNCATTVRDALGAGGINLSPTIYPKDLMRNLQQKFWGQP